MGKTTYVNLFDGEPDLEKYWCNRIVLRITPGHWVSVHMEDWKGHSTMKDDKDYKKWKYSPGSQLGNIDLQYLPRLIEALAKICPVEDAGHKFIYRIIDKETGKFAGSYSRAYHDEYDFKSAESAINANCHGMFKDREKYRIVKVEVLERVVFEDCFNPVNGSEDKTDENN